jgi:hypothetical protein
LGVGADSSSTSIITVSNMALDLCQRFVVKKNAIQGNENFFLLTCVVGLRCIARIKNGGDKIFY